MFVITSTYLILKCERTPTLMSFICCQTVVFIWTFIYSIENLTNPASHLKTIFVIIESIPISYLGTTWLTFCLKYTDLFKRISRKITFISYIISFLTSFMFITNPYHSMIFSRIETYGLDREPLFYIIIAIINLQYILGATLLAYYSLKRTGAKKRQAFLLIIATLSPWICSALTLTPIIPKGYDLTPASFSITLSLSAIAIYKYDFLNITPIAFEKVVNNIKQAVVILDNNNIICEVNSMFIKTFSFSSQLKIGDNILRLIDLMKPQICSNDGNEGLFSALEDIWRAYPSAELEMTDGSFFQVYINYVSDKKENIIGRILSLTDITEIKKLLMQLEEKNLALKTLAEKSEELAVIETRNNFAQNVYDTLGYPMTALISVLESSNSTVEHDAAKSKEKIIEATNIARISMERLRSSIKEFSPSFIDSLRELINEWKSPGVNIDLTIMGAIPTLNFKYSKLLLKVCKEGITNSKAHGRANNITVMFHFSKEKVRLFILDDGIGCKNIIKGKGLNGIDKEVSELSGAINIGSDGEKGFNLNMEFPFLE
ncbi:MAG: histidine kinase N-terminal 7TM domain-containing protein [Bacillota bacterium]|nr:histidine kinase N-terminal 7TM domain-containing protein [Bacillota bacterium]